MKKVKCICWCGRGGCGADITGDTCCIFHVAYSGGGCWNDDGVWSIPVVDCLKYEMGLGRRVVGGRCGSRRAWLGKGHRLREA